MNAPRQVERGPDDKQARYKYIAFQINREDGLVNYRLTWTLQFNGFLFAALALTSSEMDGLLKVLPIAGMTVSIAGLLGTIAANIAIRDLKHMWLEDEDSRWPRPFGDTVAFRLGLAPSIMLPSVLTVVWSYLLCRLCRLCRFFQGGNAPRHHRTRWPCNHER